jgi:hypothetical protein
VCRYYRWVRANPIPLPKHQELTRTWHYALACSDMSVDAACRRCPAAEGDPRAHGNGRDHGEGRGVQPLRSDDPARVGSYRLRVRLGAGGMGRVYLASTLAGRSVALKVVRSELGEDPEFRIRFRREIEAAQRVAYEPPDLTDCPAPPSQIIEFCVTRAAETSESGPPWLAWGQTGAATDSAEPVQPFGTATDSPCGAGPRGWGYLPSCGFAARDRRSCALISAGFGPCDAVRRVRRAYGNPRVVPARRARA